LHDARVELVSGFDEAISMLLDGRADRVLQCAAHPDFARTIGGNRGRAFAVDCFIAPGRELAVLTRARVDEPRSIGLQPATASYVDLARWRDVTHEPTTVAVAQGLLEGRYDSGVAALDLAARHPTLLRVDERLGPVDDVWVVYGASRACVGGILASAPGGER
jgi:hypothetical protein